MQIALCDGSSLGNPGPAKIGVVYWERFRGTHSTERMRPTLTISRSLGVATNNDAEWQAVLEAFRLIASRGQADQGYVYTDSLLVVEQFAGRYKARQNNTKAYVAEASTLVERCRHQGKVLTLTWLPRQLTYLADKEAGRKQDHG